ncbi:MAG: AAA family ATPase [Eubacteriales bacterium]|nr:AAA family ATPase [Eubacteriales bacterium]
MNQALYSAVKALTENPLKGERIKKEMIDFLTYLSASDGTISNFESDFIKEYLGVDMTPDEISAYITENNTFSKEFEQKVPNALAALAMADKRKIAREKSANSAEVISEALTYVRVFEAMGKEFIVCDGRAADEEVRDFTTYTTMLNKHLTDTLGDISGIKTSVDTEEIHAGETAPMYDENGERLETLEELLEQLNELVGLDEVKKDVNSLIHLQEVRKLRKQRRLKDIPVSNHLVFYGNPGTGKTTVARLLAKIYHRMGILSTGAFVEVDRAGLVGGYVGQTAIKTKEVIDKAMGGVLFIDEAYSLTYNRSENDYGMEAVDTILKAMEDNRDNLIVIVAGYPDLMAEFIDSNPGLRSRFNKYINFMDYDPEELMQIYISMCEKSGYTNTEEAAEYVKSYLEEKYTHRGKNFANAREVRNLLEKAMLKQADRLHEIKDPTNEQICTLEIEDVAL